MRREVPERAVSAAKQLLRELSRRFRIEKAYLFGSYAKGSWLYVSDVDLVIVSPDFKGMRFMDRLEHVYRAAWSLRISPAIEAIPLTPEELEEKKNSSVVISDASKYWIEISDW
ncbi:MAG: nucleotidyltransferase domain-containing protein [Aigarchaeota archaeon]|nr:nucleotidyltransferase domain-containing protein [Candidatus Pelearchaeum maunauluense]